MAKQKTIDPIVELKEPEPQGQVLDLAVSASAIVSCAEIIEDRCAALEPFRESELIQPAA